MTKQKEPGMESIRFSLSAKSLINEAFKSLPMSQESKNFFGDAISRQVANPKKGISALCFL